MPVILVANPKGGVGKSTLATHIAGYFASRGHAVMLGDVKFTIKPDNTLDFADQDNTYKAVLHKCAE